jgi:ring-1,2-phenylacetyl-CoA epoxidase subunit PaaE
VAAGSGITPVLSIAASVLDLEPASDVVLLYGNRSADQVMFVEELSDLKDRYPQRLQVLHVLSREEQTPSCSPGGSTATGCCGSPAPGCCPWTRSTSGTCAGPSAWSPTRRPP